MNRSVVYPEGVVNRKAPERQANPPMADSDAYRDKLIKFVPAEAVSFFAVATVIVTDSWPDAWRYVVLVLGATIAILYPTAVSRTAPTVPWFNYVLVTASFLAWALGTSSFGGELFGWPTGANKIVLAAAVPIIPALDELLVRTTLRVKARKRDQRAHH
jgi:hypothetical protein